MHAICRERFYSKANTGGVCKILLLVTVGRAAWYVVGLEMKHWAEDRRSLTTQCTRQANSFAVSPAGDLGR